MDKLRDRVQQMGQEQESSSASHPEKHLVESKAAESLEGLDMQAMLDRFYQLKSAIVECNKNSPNPG